MTAARRAAELPTADPGRGLRGRFLDALTAARPRHSSVRGDIEGLRAVAVIFVLLFHLQVAPFTGGFAGVDVFFVISGFLITSQLLAQVRRRGRLHLASFYARRAKRLLPASTLVLVTTVLVGWAWLPRSEWKVLATDSAAAAFYGLNWVLAARSVDYLAADAHPTAVQHYWSLAVEEQFYLVWPLAIMAALWLARRRRWSPIATVGGTLVVILASSLTWSVTLTADLPERAFFVSTTRAWELAIGAVVAAAVPRLRRLPHLIATVIAPVGLAMVLASAFLVSTQTTWPGWSALLPTVGTALVVVAGTAHDHNLVARLLGWGPMPWIGMLSYSIYLWHWPLIVFATARDPQLAWWEMVLIGAASVVLSALTLRFVEDPVRFSPRVGRRPWAVLVAAVAAMVCSLSVSLLLLSQAPRLTSTVDVLDPTGPQSTVSVTPSSGPQPVVGDYLGALALVENSSVVGVPTLRPDVDTATAITRPVRPAAEVAGQDRPAAYDNGCARSKTEVKVATGNECLLGDPSGTVRVALVGDSKMDQWQPALDLIGKRHDWRVQTFGKSGCTFSAARQYGDCDSYNQALLAALLADPPDIVITSTYDQRSNVAPGMIDHLSQLQAAGSTIVLINDNPTPTPVEVSIYQCVERAKSFQACDFERNAGHGAPALTQVLVSLPQATFIDLNDWICPPGLDRCPTVLGNVFLYRETSHLTVTFVRSMTPILERKLAEAGLVTGAVLPLQPR